MCCRWWLVGSISPRVTQHHAECGFRNLRRWLYPRSRPVLASGAAPKAVFAPTLAKTACSWAGVEAPPCPSINPA